VGDGVVDEVDRERDRAREGVEDAVDRPRGLVDEAAEVDLEGLVARLRVRPLAERLPVDVRERVGERGDGVPGDLFRGRLGRGLGGCLDGGGRLAGRGADEQTERAQPSRWRDRTWGSCVSRLWAATRGSTSFSRARLPLIAPRSSGGA